VRYKDTDVDEQPASWAVFPGDVRYGKQILRDKRGFIESLKRKELSVKTVNRYIDALWLLGGKIIDAANNEEKNRTKEPLNLLLEMIDEEGGPLMDCSEDQAAFDRTCKKIYRFLFSSLCLLVAAILT
jgi:hypothetical protein